jgi:hypothetical protein
VVIYHVFNIYAIRVAGVFMISLATIWLSTGVMRRCWAYLTYVLALVLLQSIDYSYWVTLILVCTSWFETCTIGQMMLMAFLITIHKLSAEEVSSHASENLTV